MDEQEELAKLKWILFAGIAFLISGYYSYQELKYTVWSSTAEANVTRTYTSTKWTGGGRGRRRWGRRREFLAVEYTFTDQDGKQHSERDGISIHSPAPGPKVNVQYFSGVENSSRIEGHSSKVAVWVFLGCCALLVFAGFKLYQMASEAVDGNPRLRRR